MLLLKFEICDLLAPMNVYISKRERKENQITVQINMQGIVVYSSHSVELTERHVQGTDIDGAEENEFIAKSELGRSCEARLPSLLLISDGH